MNPIKVLSPREIDRYHSDGFIGPFDLCAREGMSVHRARIVDNIFEHGRPVSGHSWNARHIDSRVVYDLCTDPVIVDALKSIYGRDLLLWNSSFWIKDTDTAATPWHQDLHYWPLPISFTAWIAITDTESDTSCLRVIPGSHRSVLPVRKARSAQLFEKVTDSSLVDDGKVLHIEMRAGQVVFFGDRLVHSSDQYISKSGARIGLAARYTFPWVKLPMNVIPFFPSYQAFLISGRDHFGLNKIGCAPAD